MISTDQLAASALTLGQLMGLLLPPTGDNYPVNTDWFADPVSNLEAADTRFDQLADLLHELLANSPDAPLPAGFGAAQWPPAVFEGANWLMVPNPAATDGTSSLYVVVPPKGQAKGQTGQIGLGLLLPFTQTSMGFGAYVYAPLLSYTAQDPTVTAQFLFDQASTALQVGLSGASVTGSISSGSVSVSGLAVAASIYLGNQTPAVQLTLLGPKPPTTSYTYSSFTTLLNATDAGWPNTSLGQAVNSWLNQPIKGIPLKPGALLASVGLLKNVTTDATKPPQYVLTPGGIGGQTPAQVAQTLLWSLLDQYSQAKNQLLTLPGGGVSVAKKTLSGTDTYGLNVQATIPLASSPDTDKNKDKATGTDKPKAKPAVSALVIGSWLSGESATDNWLTRSLATDTIAPPPGLNLWLISQNAGKVQAFAPAFSMGSAGLNIAGKAGQPLVNLNGYLLSGAELRAVLTKDAGWTYGFAAKLDGLGLPLAPALSGAKPTGDPVAQGLLQGGSAPAAASTPAAGDPTPANPTFGAAVAWYKGGRINAQLFDAQDKPSTKVLLPINRTLGPLHCERIGVGWVDPAGQAPTLSVLFDGDVHIGPLTIALEELTVDIPVQTPTDTSKYHFGLQGLSVDFAASSVQLSAALVKVLVPATASSAAYTEYDGTATLEAGSFAISALGSYAQPTEDGSDFTSLFIFGTQLTPLGGPAFFYVTGLAAGFGYNRGLVLPAQAAVPTFPLVQAIKDPTSLGAKPSSGGTWTFPKPAEVLAKMDAVVPPQRGEYWLAAGVRFTSFDLINTTALVSVAFGQELQIGVTGLSWMSLPPPPKPGAPPPKNPYAYVEWGTVIEVLPKAGSVTATALLSTNSYVIDPDCHLTGGAAFYAWFGSNPHAGEFVFTVGGYHPAFTPPAYFPQVPRLAFNWQVSDSVSISGDAYFALTASAVMAGGGLQVLFSDGNLQAWFTAQMDALVVWVPFQYEVDISVSIGVSYRMHLLFVSVTLRVELGVSLTLWGPRMGGTAHISWYVISFSVGFGADRPDTQPALPWLDDQGQGFAQTLLPHSGADGATTAKIAALGSEADSTAAGILTLTPLAGLAATEPGADGDVWVVRPGRFRFAALTAFPLTAMQVTTQLPNPPTVEWLATDYCPDGSDYFVSVRPMQLTMKDSELKVSLTLAGDDGKDQPYELAGNFAISPSIAPVPAAKWGRPLGAQETAEPNAMLAGRLLGFESIIPQHKIGSGLVIDTVLAFAPERIDNNPNYLPLSGTAAGSPVPKVSPGEWSTVWQTLADKAQARTEVYNTLVTQFGLDPQTNGPVSVPPANSGAWLNGQPLILAST